MKYCLLFLFSFIILLGCTQPEPIYTEPIVDENITIPSETQILLIKFRGTSQCVSCENLGKFADLTIRQYFPEQHEQETIKYLDIDAQKYPNDPYVLKYQPKYAQLVMITTNGDNEKIEELSEAWYYTSNYNAYSEYLVKKIKQVIK